MPRTGHAVKEMLLELAQTDETILPPFGVEKIQRTIEDIKEHHAELSRINLAVEAETRRQQGLPENSPTPIIPWEHFPDEYSATVIHSTCIQHYKRGLLACTMERVERLKHIHWNRNDYSTDIAGNLAPLEVEFLLQYEQILKKFADACGLATDLSMDATPPKSKCVQVRVLMDHGDMMSKEGKVVLQKDTTHWLPLDEVEALLRAGVVEYLHTGMTM